MQRQAYLLLILTALFWAGNAIGGKLAVGHVSPMLLSALRWLIACAILLAVGHRHVRADWLVIRRNAMLLTFLGFFGFTLFSVALYSALMFTTAINASVLQAGMPAIIFVANFWLFRLRTTTGQVFGFLLSLVGVAIAATQGEPSRLLALDVNIGDALVLVAAIVYALYTTVLRRKPDMHWISFMVALTAAGFVTSVPFALAEYAHGTMIAPDATGWAIIAYTALFPSTLAQAFYIRGVNLIGGNRAGLFINLVPIFGTLLSIALLGEEVHVYHAAALALVLGGIAIAEWSGRNAGG
ncbi:DMT family transporter [Mesorhizobium sp. J428]|uniref:DMT family transporter n=1 Tax=Mesorhizobium sp. J428 TaxID=2898440 RepID=UPI002150E7EA|nr:DMT family transporter [Mesorhizobium sp. J428]MCR5856563.1 DMT family transporter [Mesorhizobium sp. J428]